MKNIHIFIVSLFFLIGCKPLVDKFAFHPDNVNVISVKELPGEIREIKISAEDNVKTISLYLRSKESDKLVIYFHGNAGNIYHRIPGLLQINKIGVNVIGVSYRGYGKSDGVPSEDGVYLDGEAVLQYAVEQLGFSKKNIIIFGRSIGTTVAINTVQNMKVGALILVTPLTSGKEHAEHSGLGLISFMAGDSFNNIEKITNIDAPLLVVHGTNDQVIPYSMGRKVFDRANVDKKFITINGGGHNNLHETYAQQYWLPILNFIQDI
jgi:fermentation-respiration switch protein FrsA (DUF1100 family)